MVHHTKVKLGKLAARHDARTSSLLATYLTSQLPAPPPALDYSQRRFAAWPMYLNDKVGDCTCAAAGHMIEVWTSLAQKATVAVPDAAIPQGVRSGERLQSEERHERQRRRRARRAEVLASLGVRLAQDQRLRRGRAGQPSPHPASARPVRWCLHRGSAPDLRAGSVGLDGARGRPDTGPGAPGSWGGHAVNVVAYDTQGLTVITWGAPLRMTWTFWNTYCDEAYALLSKDFVSKATKKAPVGFLFSELIERYLGEL